MQSNDDNEVTIVLGLKVKGEQKQILLFMLGVGVGVGVPREGCVRCSNMAEQILHSTG